MFDNLKADIARYKCLNGRSTLYNLTTQLGLWNITEYRFASWVFRNVRIPVLRQILMKADLVWHLFTQICTGIDIPCTAKIGKGLYIGHFGGIVLHGDCVLGENCNIRQGVTIGLAGCGENSGVPVIGDRVYIAPGAKVIGKITVGNDVAIGANAVVTKDLPNNAVAVGVPARIINYNGSSDFIKIPPP